MENIIASLRDIEQSKKVKILYACETGSRAWGFPSPDSDYDVRFIYMHETEWYLSLYEKKDTIEVLTSDDLDITGWDLKKSLVLLSKSNAPLIERFQSPIEYLSEPGIKDDFKSLIEKYYSPRAVFFHHYSLAKKFWEDIKDNEEIKLKGYFYLIRSLLSCNWIKNSSGVLPMHIEGLMTVIDIEVRDRLRELIRLKAQVGEKYVYKKDKDLSEWILGLWDAIGSTGDQLPVNETRNELLNEFFLKTLYGKNNDRLG